MLTILAAAFVCIIIILLYHFVFRAPFKGRPFPVSRPQARMDGLKDDDCLMAGLTYGTIIDGSNALWAVLENKENFEFTESEYKQIRLLFEALANATHSMEISAKCDPEKIA